MKQMLAVLALLISVIGVGTGIMSHVYANFASKDVVKMLIDDIKVIKKDVKTLLRR